MRASSARLRPLGEVSNDSNRWVYGVHRSETQTTASKRPATRLSETLSECLDVHAPVAVRAIDLDASVEMSRLPPSRSGEPYRSVAALVQRAGWPLGWIAVPVSAEGDVSLEMLDGLGETLQSHNSSPSLVAVTGPLDDQRDGESASAVLLSVVIATCADSKSTLRCVEAIRSKAVGPYEVIVVENRPTNSTVRQALAESFPGDERIRYVEEPRPGLAPARNAGLAAARGTLIAFTDDDVLVDGAWVSAIRAAFAAKPSVACVTGLILPFELETTAQLLVERFASFGKGFAPRVYSLDDPPVDQPLFPYTAGYFGSGANMAFRVDVIREMGGFDPILGTGTPARGGEDLDACIRLLRAGYELAYEPRAIVWHRHPDTHDGLRRRAFDYGAGLGAMLSKHILTSSDRWKILARAPQGLRYFNDPRSRKNRSRGPVFPRDLNLLERAGLAFGPIAYITSQLKALR